jgi:beta-lactamase superfamily II metal-dependent hydrolase
MHSLEGMAQTPNGKDIVIDLGIGSHGSDKQFSPLRHMKRNGVSSIEHLVITHPHADHLDDIMNLDNLGISVMTFSRPRCLTQAALEEGMDEDRKERLAAFFEMDARYNAPVAPENMSDVPDNWGGLTFRTYFPNPGNNETNINNHSIVTVFRFGGIKVVVPGDNEPSSWSLLRGLNGFETDVANADVLVAPHHGRASGYDEEVVKLINPRLTIISDKFSETTAADKYTRLSRGWSVHKSDGTSQDRKCLTTRKDGRVQVEFWYEESERRPYLNVSIV